MRLVSIAAGTPQYIATSRRTSCTFFFVPPCHRAPVVWARYSARLLGAAVIPSITSLDISVEGRALPDIPIEIWAEVVFWRGAQNARYGPTRLSTSAVENIF